MRRFRYFTIASAVAAAFAIPVALAQQGGANDSSNRIQQRDATGNPAGSPTQPPRSMSSDRAMDRSSGGRSQQHGASTVRDVQQALQSKGFDVGTIDGVMGPRTQAALRQFQQQQGMTSSGRLDQQTLSALNVSAAGDRSGTMGGTTPPSSSSGPTGPMGGTTPPPSSSSGSTGSRGPMGGTPGTAGGSAAGRSGG